MWERDREIDEQQHFEGTRDSGDVPVPGNRVTQLSASGCLEIYAATLTLSSRHLKALGQILDGEWCTAGTLHFCRLHTFPNDSDKRLLFLEVRCLNFLLVELLTDGTNINP